MTINARKCPHCDCVDTNIVGTIDFENDDLTVYRECEKCETIWISFYTLYKEAVIEG